MALKIERKGRQYSQGTALHLQAVYCYVTTCQFNNTSPVIFPKVVGLIFTLPRSEIVRLILGILIEDSANTIEGGQEEAFWLLVLCAGISKLKLSS